MTKSQNDVNVFATDTILATLMCCTRSAYSWDIVVQKIGGKVFLDKRDNTEFGKTTSFTSCKYWASCDLILLNIEIWQHANVLYILLDLLTVSETAAEPPQEEGNSLNSPRNLALEATFINHNYSQQVLKCKYQIFRMLMSTMIFNGLTPAPVIYWISIFYSRCWKAQVFRRKPFHWWYQRFRGREWRREIWGR